MSKVMITFLYNKDDIFKEKPTYLQKKETRYDTITQCCSTYISSCLILTMMYIHMLTYIYVYILNICSYKCGYDTDI